MPTGCVWKPNCGALFGKHHFLMSAKPDVLATSGPRWLLDPPLPVAGRRVWREGEAGLRWWLWGRANNNKEGGEAGVSEWSWTK